MLMNEKEAKAKWCPMSRSEGGLNRAVIIRLNDGDVKVKASAGCCCITTACMAWEWADPERRTGEKRPRGSQAASIRNGPHPDNWRWAYESDRADVVRPADIPETWTLERPGVDDLMLYWTEPEAEHKAALEEAERTWPERRRGYCKALEARS